MHFEVSEPLSEGNKKVDVLLIIIILVFKKTKTSKHTTRQVLE